MLFNTKICLAINLFIIKKTVKSYRTYTWTIDPLPIILIHNLQMVDVLLGDNWINIFSVPFDETFLNGYCVILI